jgi:hypothetical protein
MHTMFKAALTVGVAAICATSLGAQTQETKTTTTTKVEIKGGKDVTAVGCLGRSLNGDYVLTNVRQSRRLESSRYTLVTSDDLSKHVGERVEIKGKAVVDGHGTVTAESKTKTEVENGKDQESKTKIEATNGALDTPVLGVKSMKSLSATCN